MGLRHWPSTGCTGGTQIISSCDLFSKNMLFERFFPIHHYQKRHFFAKFFGESIFKNHNIDSRCKMIFMIAGANFVDDLKKTLRSSSSFAKLQ
jgi:hypothetical protein